VITQETEIINHVISRTHSELILFFALFTITLIAFVLPLYYMVLKDRKAQRIFESGQLNQYIERERLVIQTIASNTEIMAGIKTVMEYAGKSNEASLSRLHNHVENQNAKFAELTSGMARIQTILERSVNNQAAMIDCLNTTLLIVDKPPHGGSFGREGFRAEGDAGQRAGTPENTQA
jgi:hypothetical protein